MPHIEMDLDAKKHVPRVARMVGLPDMQIGWGLMDLWEWCFTEKSVEVEGSQLPGFFGTIKCELVEALCAFGFLSPLEGRPGVFFVRGAPKRLGISKVRSEAGKKGGQATANSKKSLGNLRQNDTEDRSKCFDDSEAKPKPYHHSTTPPFHPSTQPPTTEGADAPRPPAEVVVETEQLPDVTGVPRSVEVTHIRWEPTEDGCWEFIQLSRVLHGFDRESERPRGFGEWFTTAYDLAGTYGIEGVLLSYLLDETIRAKSHPTSLFIGAIWKARAPETAEVAF